MILTEKIPNSLNSKEKIKIKCDFCGHVYTRRYDCVIKNYTKYGKNKCTICVRKESPMKGRKRPPEIIAKCMATRKITAQKKWPKLTIKCKCCGKEFTVPYGCRDRIYCGRSCQAKSVTHSDIRKTSICIICKKEFKHYGERILCSNACTSKYMRIARIGENNPAYNGNKENKTCVSCGKKFEYSRSGLHKEQTRVFCSLACAHKIDIKNLFLGNSVNPYPAEWSKIKKLIKERDDHTCQLCGDKENTNNHSTNNGHHIHHIDYNKKNLNQQNLIELCQKCHNATHHGRTFWEIIFSGLISGSPIIKKDWGAEVHIANNNNYCLKYLIFFKDKQFSFHVHSLKTELCIIVIFLEISGPYLFI